MTASTKAAPFSRPSTPPPDVPESDRSSAWASLLDRPAQSLGSGSTSKVETRVENDGLKRDATVVAPSPNRPRPPGPCACFVLRTGSPWPRRATRRTSDQLLAVGTGRSPARLKRRSGSRRPQLVLRVHHVAACPVVHRVNRGARLCVVGRSRLSLLPRPFVCLSSSARVCRPSCSPANARPIRPHGPPRSTSRGRMWHFGPATVTSSGYTGRTWPRRRAPSTTCSPSPASPGPSRFP